MTTSTTAEAVNQTPIKERLLAELRKHSDPHGKVRLKTGELGRRFGLNRHDLQKNLFQLQSEGILVLDAGTNGNGSGELLEIKRVRIRKAHLNGLALQRPKVLSVTERVRQWVIHRPQQKDGWVVATPQEIRANLGLEGNTVSVAISDLQRRGEAEVRKEGARIVAIRILPKAPPVHAEPPPEEAPMDTPTRVEIPPTPHLDQYLSAKRLSGLVPEKPNPYITVEFREDPIANEALALRDALRAALGED